MNSKPLDVYFDSYYRGHVLSLHHAYVEGVRFKLLPLFENLEAEAEAFGNAEYERLCSQPGSEDGPDLGDLADSSHDRAISHYQDMVFVKRELTCLSTAGMYHLWERSSKRLLLDRAISDYGNEDFLAAITDAVEQASFDKLICWLKNAGFNCKSEAFWDDFEILPLIAHTVKHGEGLSFRKLHEKRPNLFDPFPGFDIGPLPKKTAEDLWISSDVFRELAIAIETFWNRVPTDLTIRIPIKGGGK